MIYEIECPCCGFILKLNIEDSKLTSVESPHHEDFLCNELIETGSIGGESSDE